MKRFSLVHNFKFTLLFRYKITIKKNLCNNISLFFFAKILKTYKISFLFELLTKAIINKILLFSEIIISFSILKSKAFL
ncbi:hypothetical protein CGC49_04180 [Capnocytophaga sp. H4358]|nr:hypothetical protein CGC49_04180 [Capnocytophaga sp. H4358]